MMTDKILDKTAFLSSLTDERKHQIIDDFHKLFYYSSGTGGTWKNCYWLGHPVRKNPMDMLVYQELIYKLRPDYIIETGSFYGGSALFFASVCELIGYGKVISIDININPSRPNHDRITYLIGDSVSDEIIRKVGVMVDGKKCIAILDSDHTAKHVLRELELYNKFVPVDGYVIVEDTNINDHPVYPEHGPGPMEAVMEFVGKNNNFVIDKGGEKFMLTFAENGFLRRIKLDT